MDSKRVSLKFTIPKAVKRYLAWILAVAMIFSGVPLSGYGGVIQVLADNTELVDNDISGTASGPAVTLSNMLQSVNSTRELAWVDGSSISIVPSDKTPYYFDLADTSQKYATEGTYGLISIAAGTKNALTYHSEKYGLAAKEGQYFTIQVPGNSYIVVSGDNNSAAAATITATSNSGVFQEDTLSTNTSGHCDLEGCKAQGENSISFLYVGNEGSVTLTMNGSTAYICAICVIPADDDITLKQYEQKTFSFSINGTDISVTSGESEAENSSVTVENGKLELATIDTAIVWANLLGNGEGKVTSSMISNISENVEVSIIEENKISVEYKDTEKNPTSYTIFVKDSSASGIPDADGITTFYNFKDGSIVSTLYNEKYALTGGNSISSTDGLLELTGNKKIYYNGTHGIYINDGDTISVKVAGDATISFELCEYTNSQQTGSTLSASGMANGATITPTSVDARVETDKDSEEFEYIGDATTLTFTYTGGTGYIHSISVTNKKEVNGTLMAATISYDVVECASLTAVYDNVVSDLEVTPTKIIFDEEPVSEKLSIIADTTDKMGDGYQVSIDKTNHVIQVSHSNINTGNTVIASIPYAVFTVALIGKSESYDFKATETVFGEAAVTAETELLSSDSCIKLVSTNALDAITKGHGLYMQKGTTTFTVKIPGNAMGTFTIKECQYANCTATMSVDGVEQRKDVSLKGSDDVTGTELFEYKNTTNKEVEMTIEISVTGSEGFIHGISYEVTEIPEEATVSGNVGTDVAGEELLFKKGSSTVQSVVIDADGKYSVVLSIGNSYTVEFKNSDVYEVISGNTIDMTSTVAGATITNNITYSKWDSNKSFSLTIGDTIFTITPGSSKAEDFTAVVTSGSGMVELMTTETGILWTDLRGAGNGTLSESKISAGEGITASFDGNVITIDYTDKTTNPTLYTILVKDNSATGEPSANGMPIVYNFKDGSVVSELYQGNYKISGGSSVKSTDGLLTLTGKNGIYYNGSAHGIAISNTDTISVKVAGDATISFDLCAYGANDGKLIASGMAAGGSITPENINTLMTTDGLTSTFEYTGEATTLVFTYNSSGTGYIHSMSVTNSAQPSDVKEQQEKMPEIKTYGTMNYLSAIPVGQRYVLAQTGGSLKTVDSKIDSSVSYFGFEPTTEAYRLEADVVLSVCGSSNYSGVFFGAFDENYIATVAIRNGTGLRGILSKKADDLAGASTIDASITEGQMVHFTAERTSDGFVITATPDGGSTNTMTLKYNDSGVLLFKDNGINTSISYGFILANATAIVTNMKYYNAENKLVYDQNVCYEPVGVAPVVSSVSSVAAKTRDYITVSWESSTVADGDGRYVVQVNEGNGWKDVVETTDTTYNYPISGEGDYTFRVCGKLGVNGECNEYVESEPLHVIAALPSPVVTISSTANSISLSWPAVTEAIRYEIYRYSYDESAEDVTVYETVTEASYLDTSVESEMPYYYYVVAYSADNYSNPSEIVWTVPTAGHTGDYVYEEEATEIFITKKSYDTVFTNEVVLEGLVLGDGTLTAYVNDNAADSVTLSARETFHFNLTITEGRNDVNLILTDADGNQTRQTYNFVYLTNYDIVVDAAYNGTDGTAVNGIPTYKTVQAAVDAASSGSSTANTVILVMAGDYEETNRLIVNKPYLSIIGEDRESTRIHVYPGRLGADYEAGGDMSLRCATYIQSGATGFSAENISFENDYDYSTPDGKSNKSADALRCDADQASFVNVKFTSVQDTLYMGQGHQYYYKCRIEGVVDFIYSGDNARAFFNDCEVVFLYESTKTSGYVCAPRTAADATYGLTFYHCIVIGEEGCSGNGYLLARPWGPNAYITWINCYMGNSIYKVLPYGDMSGNLYKNARFYEYGTYGPAFAINSDRRQISPSAAKEMVSNSFLEWEPDTVTNKISDCYIGTVKTEREPQYVIAEYSTDSYLQTDGDDTGLRAYNLEGYANAYGVSGGGLLKESSDNYYEAGNAKEFLNALISAKSSGKKSVIELTADINLGCYEVEDFDSYSSIIKPYEAQALTHPTLIKSGVSVLTLTDMYNLTIFSSNGSSIKHVNITMKNVGNIMIRNIKFDELWEWDEETEGGYDRNDWDYMTIDQGCDGIWIDHCTFYKAYDGVIDVKNPNPLENVTISWCEFLPGSEEDTFFHEMMDELSQNSSKYPYYSHLLEGMTSEQIYLYAYGQKKTHLFGQGDDATNAVGIRVTLANNYYKNSMDRMPRLRYGNSHVYNCIMDAQELLDAKNGIASSEMAQKIVSNGASSTCGAQVLLENCYISGIINALNSGNGSSPAGYINAVNSVYYMDGVKTELEPKSNSTADNRVLITNAEEFTSNLPYSGYILYNAEKLYMTVQPYVGAGKLSLTTLQWEKTSYNDDILPDTDPDVEPPTEEPGTEPPTDEPETEPPTSEEPGTEPPTDEPETEPPTDEPETEPPTSDEPEITTPDDANNSYDDDDDDYEERETSSLTNREENLVANVVGTFSVKEVTENNSGKLVVTVNNEVVFIEKNGTLSKDKWQQVESSWYFFGTDSKAVGGWLEQNGKWYHLNEINKKMETGWLQTADGKWYLLDHKNGDMKTGWQQTTDGKWYLLDNKNGDMKTGWQQTADGKWYLLDYKNGDMKTGWQQTTDGKWYLLDSRNGDMKTGWQQTADGKWYLLDSKNGDMKIGWQMVKGLWYYLTTTGAMAEDTITPDGYKVGKDGAWTGEKVR